ncbi:protein LIM2-like [Cocos nucifera]|nr:protein LIM2-like [Cocos nucifera]
MEAGAATKTTMARAWFVILLLAAGLAGHAAGQACTNTFFSALVQLIPCRPAVSPFSPAQPSEACCNAVKTLGQPCLCELVNGPPITGVDRYMAMQLPGKCTVNFQPCGSGV